MNRSIEFSVPAPAKLNHMLHITGRRLDGYHLLQTLFQLLDFGDDIHFKAKPADTPSVALSQNLAEVPAPNNLITQAANILRPYATQPYAVSISFTKRIPMGGGLGGGSSDAATTLLALNYLWGCHQTLAQLAALGVQLGADIPLFVMGRSAWASGIGEQLTPVDLPTYWFVVCHPNIHVSTAAVFAHPDLTRNSQETTIQAAVDGHGHNDCEPVVRRNYPEIAAMLDRLNTYGTARLTGTGACGFLTVQDAATARTLAKKLQQHYSTFVAQGVNVSPAHTSLNKFMNPNLSNQPPK